MPRSYPSEFRRKVLDLVEEGRPVAEISDQSGASGEAILQVGVTRIWWTAGSGRGSALWSQPSWPRPGNASQC